MYPQMPDTKYLKGFYKESRGDTCFIAVKTSDTWKKLSKWGKKEDMESDIVEFVEKLIPYDIKIEVVELTPEIKFHINNIDSTRNYHTNLILDFPDGYYYEDRRWGIVKPNSRNVEEFHIYKWMGKFFVYATVYDFISDTTYPEAISIKSSLLEMAQDVEKYKKKLIDEQSPMGISPKIMEMNISGKIASAIVIETEEFAPIIEMETRINRQNPNREEWILPIGDYKGMKMSMDNYFNK